ncbi:MAG: hypothetical protein NW220_05830 [Leptolyngbyaceae cyanobacterium bins.349]|nr:hypothetical protein [Leptolyngbyaceae cyanobacterium bins.349]
MATLKHNRLSWLSLTLLLISYTWFGWYLCGLKTRPLWLSSACYRIFGEPLASTPATIQMPEAAQAPTLTPERTSSQLEGEQLTKKTTVAESPVQTTPEAASKSSLTDDAVQPPAYTQTICSAVIKYNLPAGLLAVGWILVSSVAFISPLTSIGNFINRWFQSDTVAFLTIFLLAGLAAVILYWLHIFLQIITILAVDILARIDIQYAGLTGTEAFWILTLVSLTGLVLGWTANAIF